MKVRSTAWILISLWLIFAVLQTFGILQVGLYPIGLFWTVYLTAAFLTVVFFDYRTKFKSKSVPVVYFLILAHFVIFNAAIIFGWYEYSEIVNRIEHAYGGFIATFAIWAVLQQYSNYTEIRSNFMKFIIVVGLVSMLGCVNEIVELFLDFLVKYRTIGPSVWDTNIDLLMNYVGMGVFLGFSFFKTLKSRN